MRKLSSNFRYVWLLLELFIFGGFLGRRNFSVQRNVESVFVRSQWVWYSKGGAISFGLLAPCLKTYLLSAFNQLGKEISLTDVWLSLQSRRHVLCVSATGSSAAKRVSPRWRLRVSSLCWNRSPGDEQLKAGDNGQCRMKHVLSVHCQWSLGVLHIRKWCEIAGMWLLCAERVEGCLMACRAFKTDLMLLP